MMHTRTRESVSRGWVIAGAHESPLATKLIGGLPSNHHHSANQPTHAPAPEPTHSRVHHEESAHNDNKEPIHSP